MPASRPSRRKTLAWVIGALLIAGAGLWFAPREPSAPPLDDIDSESRERLEAVLRDADRDEP